MRGETLSRAARSVTDKGVPSRWPAHASRSSSAEEVYVISGTFNDGVRDYPAGTFLHAPAGSWHVSATTTGCTLFLFYPQG
ncbi:hypothetical protein GCM10023322_33210 [Rugosimonospora acidiphila]|uniref:ChrR-like cupin domain-containing protein n=1 Tax=Rugosimonospora acidiphila TaxID=556531 RepID=A0ABP9RV87_9ACTN